MVVAEFVEGVQDEGVKLLAVDLAVVDFIEAVEQPRGHSLSGALVLQK